MDSCIPLPFPPLGTSPPALLRTPISGGGSQADRRRALKCVSRMEPSATTPLLAREPAAEDEGEEAPSAAPSAAPAANMSDATFSIAVRTFDGTTHPVDVTSASTIADVKKAVLGAVCAPADATFRLIAAGKICPDAATLSELNVQVCMEFACMACLLQRLLIVNERRDPVRGYPPPVHLRTTATGVWGE